MIAHGKLFALLVDISIPILENTPMTKEKSIATVGRRFITDVMFPLIIQHGLKKHPPQTRPGLN
jgi:hypothetical protein